MAARIREATARPPGGGATHTPRVQLHFPPTYLFLPQSSAVVARQARAGCHRPRHFTSVLTDLAGKLMRYIRLANQIAKPVKCKYSDPRRRITTTSAVTNHPSLSQKFDPWVKLGSARS